MIKVENLHKKFADNYVLNGVDMQISKGQSMVIIGGSGTGKSVLLKCILGLEKHDQGKIFINGEDILKFDNNKFLSNFGMLFQNAALFDSLCVWKNVAFRLLQGQNKMSEKQAKEVAVEKLRRVGLTPEVSDKFPAELSGGMQKRVGLARAIASNPEIIFFDEPTTGLDSYSAEKIVRKLSELNSNNRTIVMTLHQPNSEI